jgi:hypothetical protein
LVENAAPFKAAQHVQFLDHMSDLGFQRKETLLGCSGAYFGS